MTAELVFDAEDERTWQWLLTLLGLDPWQAVICTECGYVWPTGCHLTEGLAHLESAEHLDAMAVCGPCGHPVQEGHPGNCGGCHDCAYFHGG